MRAAMFLATSTRAHHSGAMETKERLECLASVPGEELVHVQMALCTRLEIILTIVEASPALAAPLVHAFTKSLTVVEESKSLVQYASTLGLRGQTRWRSGDMTIARAVSRRTPRRFTPPWRRVPDGRFRGQPTAIRAHLL